jgi:hypothetical protein
MPKSYQKKSKKREGGIPRPFSDFKPEEVRRAFDSVIGAKPFPSDAEIALLERARKFCAPLKHCPGVARVWVCNSLSMNAADKDSDIDLFIEATPGRIWTARVFSTLYFQILGIRRYGNKVKGRFCLSFFATSGADFSKIAIEDDVYLYEWVRRLVMVAQRTDGTENGPIGNFLESLFKRLFLPRTLAEYERLGRPWGVRIDDEFLKFHPEDRRVEIREEVRRRLTEKA